MRTRRLPFATMGPGAGGGIDQAALDAAIATHAADTTAVHGVANTATLAPVVFGRVTGDITMADANLADRLTVPLEANSTYVFYADVILFNASTGDDYKLQFNIPAGADGQLSIFMQNSAATAATGSVFTGEQLYGSSFVTGGIGATVVTAMARGLVITAGTAGNLALQAAKNADTGADAVLVENTRILCFKVA